MEELSIEEKAKAYDEALEKAKIWQKHLYDVNDKDYADELNYIFPELKESEDERIRKEIIDFVKSRGGFKGEWIAWLEKQSEQKEDNPPFNDTKYLAGFDAGREVQKIFDEQKPTWSEEDETNLNDAIDACKAKYGNMSYTADWLKSLKDRYTWRPSDRQIEILKDFLFHIPIEVPEKVVLVSLYHDLLKLKE